MSDQAAVIQALRDAAVDGEIACADAHDIAGRFGLAPIEIGRLLNRETDLRVFRCQLGLFGYGPKAEGKSKIVLPATNLPQNLVDEIMAHAVDGHISCADAWTIADQARYPRLGIGNVIEALGLRVKPCQLGCF
jgi:hypothetical protein